jgi:hypothetical protein
MHEFSPTLAATQPHLPNIVVGVSNKHISQTMGQKAAIRVQGEGGP